MRKNPSLLLERLDYLLVSAALRPLIEEMHIEPSFRSDHSIPWLVMKQNLCSRGPGFWKLNTGTSLLSDERYCEEIKLVIQSEIDKNLIPAMTWELIKMSVRGTTIQYTTRKKQENEDRLNRLQKLALELEKDLACLAEDQLSIQYKHKECIDIKKEIEKIINHKTMGAAIRCNANWLEMGEKSSKYFFALEEHRGNKKNITRIRKSSTDEILGNQKEIDQELVNLFSNLYKSDNIPVDYACIYRISLMHLNYRREKKTYYLNYRREKKTY